MARCFLTLTGRPDPWLRANATYCDPTRGQWSVTAPYLLPSSSWSAHITFTADENGCAPLICPENILISPDHVDLSAPEVASWELRHEALPQSIITLLWRERQLVTLSQSSRRGGSFTLAHRLLAAHCLGPWSQHAATPCPLRSGVGRESPGGPCQCRPGETLGRSQWKSSANGSRPVRPTGQCHLVCGPANDP